MSEAELGKRIYQKIKDGDGRVSFAFSISPILKDALADFPVLEKDKNGEYVCLLPGEVEEIADWVRKWLGDLSSSLVNADTANKSH